MGESADNGPPVRKSQNIVPHHIAAEPLFLESENADFEGICSDDIDELLRGAAQARDDRAELQQYHKDQLELKDVEIDQLYEDIASLERQLRFSSSWAPDGAGTTLTGTGG